MEFFNYEGHRKLWLLLAENIYVATKENYNGNGYYNAYSALEKLKKELLCLHFSAEERNPRNYCFACQAAKLYQEAIWIRFIVSTAHFCGRNSYIVMKTARCIAN